MSKNVNPRRPKADDDTDSCKHSDRQNGHGGSRRGLPWYTELAVETAPDGANDLQIARVAWVSWDTGRDPADVWPEVLAE